jgi:16S rRNA (adenine1518-N6/adenine1519-N6)-dimethyltransferase
MKKILGQNFLINDSISKKIVKLANFCQDDEIIEIGPGNGSLTDHLLSHHNKLTLLEIDLNLIKKLKTKYRNYNLKIINEDARFFQIAGNRDHSIIGNLPYYASNKIIRNFLNQKNIKNMIFTIQKEVGQQITAADGKKSFLSFLVQSIADVKELLIIKPIEFKPMPKVDSMTVLIKPHFNNKISNDYVDFVRRGFSNPRKKIINSISMGLKRDNNEIKLLLNKTDIDHSLRPQHLTLSQWENLYINYKRIYVDK